MTVTRRQLFKGALAAAIAPMMPAPAYATGGPIRAGMTYLVGEHGPEMIIPHSRYRPVVQNNTISSLGSVAIII